MDEDELEEVRVRYYFSKNYTVLSFLEKFHGIKIFKRPRGENCSSSQNRIKLNLFKVVVCAEILPRDFLQTLGNNYLSLTEAKIKGYKKFHR